VSYTVADVINATGLKRRTVQFWADRGVIRATKATQEGGSGVHRSFTRNELIVACILHPIALGWQGDQTRTLSELTQVANHIRLLVKAPVACDDFEQAIAGTGQFYLILTWIFGDEIKVTSVETAMPNLREAKSYDFRAMFQTLEQTPGRSEVLYLNEWLRPLREV
jgi:DNA-binding transcriptional MerR regulator